MSCAQWRNRKNAWDDLLATLKAPDWHGRNLDALHDSLSGGIIDRQPPFVVVLTGWQALPPELMSLIDDWAKVFAETPDMRLTKE